ncbi:MAG: RDD family protein [Gammaproteobacteria bacterium]|nr:RDD family protein [Gammaproteobacteria bacterium]|tara:strand:+ start:15646 stop:16041 length:396 start_codon:yes stop_codon:yes gene_type:complete
MKKINYINIGFTKNIIICIYDLLLLFSVLFFFTLPLMIFSNGEGIGQNIFYQLYLLSIIIAYYLWFWIKHNQTLGMKSWKSYIVNKDNGKKLLISQCLIRMSIALMGGHLFLLFRKESLQDILSKTKLVKL